MMTAMTIKRTGLPGKRTVAGLVIVAWAMALSLAYPVPTATGQDATGEGNCRFPDLPATSPAHADITYACRQGWFTGYPDGSFRPDRPIPAHQIATVVGRAFAAGATRADMATFLRGGNPGVPAAPARFPDVPATHPQSEDIAYAIEQSWFQGYPDDTFRPDRVITATQITAVLTRAFPTASTRAQLATFMRHGQQALNANNEPQHQPSPSKIAYEVPVYDSLGEKAARELWVADTDGSSARRLTDDVDIGWTWTSGDWEWSPDGEHIAYEVTVRDFRGNESGSELWVAEADGSDARQLTDDFAYNWLWSPSGEKIAYEVIVRDFRGNLLSSELWVADAGGSRKRRLPDVSSRWKWSPDGERIAYVVWSGFEDLWVVGADGSEARLLTHEVYIHSWEWSPDGERIAFTVFGQDSQGYEVDRELWVASLDGSDTRRLDYIDINYFINRMWWSPDGERIVYEIKENSQDEKAARELWVVGVGGSAPRRLTDDFAYNWWFLSSGERIAYQARVWEFGRWLGHSLWVAKADGSEARQLDDDIEDWRWSPNEEQIAYEVKVRDSRRTVLGSELWVAGADGSSNDSLTDIVTIQDWRWSPDGRTIVYEADVPDSSDRRRELWAVGVDGSGTNLLTYAYVLSWWGWSPNGEDIVYVVDVPDSSDRRQELWAVGVDGSGVRRLADNISVSEYGVREWGWSPDGRRFAYKVDSELWVASADGSGARRLADDAGYWRWQPVNR